ARPVGRARAAGHRDGQTAGAGPRRQGVRRLPAERPRTIARRAVQCPPRPWRNRLDAATLGAGDVAARHAPLYDQDGAASARKAEGGPSLRRAARSRRLAGRARAARGTLERTLMPHVMESAKTGRAKCRGCDRRIEKGDIRFGERVPNVFGEGETTLWFHLRCGAYKRPEPFLETLASHEIEDADALAEAAR